MTKNSRKEKEGDEKNNSRLKAERFGNGNR